VQNILTDGFKKVFDHPQPPRLFFAPGRVNLIGEHIDYNGGLVMPCALSIGTYCAILKRDDGMMNFVSEGYEPKVSVSATDLAFNEAHQWANYPKAIVTLLRDMGYDVGGFDMYITDNLPSGAGLSSSASILTLTTLAMCSLFDINLSTLDKVKLAQRAENEYIGVNCGIMDPFASAFGRKAHAMLLDCATLKFSYVPVELYDYTLIIANTNKRRGLATSKYNERRAECEAALKDLQTECDIESLCDLKPAQFERYKHLITDDVNRKRATHAVYENQRTKLAEKAMETGNYVELYHVISDSHTSLRDLYEVSCPELDALVAAALELSGPDYLVAGSRMTGAGFGGCTISFVRNDFVDEFIQKVGEKYTKETDLVADFYVAQISDGAMEIFN